MQANWVEEGMNMRLASTDDRLIDTYQPAREGSGNIYPQPAGTRPCGHRYVV